MSVYEALPRPALSPGDDKEIPRQGKRDYRDYLHDILEAAKEAEQFTAGVDR